MAWDGKTLYGFVRSWLMYRGQFWRKNRMEAFYRRLISGGDLCFDIGAHVGNRSSTWHKIGAQVVAIEPQPRLAGYLRRLTRHMQGVTVLEAAVGEKPGTETFYGSRATPTVATLDAAWQQEVRQDSRFGNIDWDESYPVKITTLDALIERFGVPAFVKIDVEGAEHHVLAGLSQALPALSFEYLPVTWERAARCIRQLAMLGQYRFVRSEVETMRFVDAAPCSGEEMIQQLQGLPMQAGSGDVYAFLSPA